MFRHYCLCVVESNLIVRILGEGKGPVNMLLTVKNRKHGSDLKTSTGLGSDLIHVISACAPSDRI